VSPTNTITGQRIEIAFERVGDPTGWPVVLAHGFPYDPHCYDEVAALLAARVASVRGSRWRWPGICAS
jgi:pimeloyl-ACP methyl ester carboxylesterase